MPCQAEMSATVPHRPHIPSQALHGPLLALAALALGAGILTGVHFGHPWWIYPCHAALVTVMTGACAFVALVLPTAWRRWAWLLIVIGQFSLLCFAYVIGYLGRKAWGTNVAGESVFRNLPTIVDRAVRLRTRAASASPSSRGPRREEFLGTRHDIPTRTLTQNAAPIPDALDPIRGSSRSSPRAFTKTKRPCHASRRRPAKGLDRASEY